MERLERKKIHGNHYYYYSRWEYKDGRCRRIWQKYLGKLEDIVTAVEGGGPSPSYAEVFEYGLSTALWKESQLAGIRSCVDAVCAKREQGLSVGQYMEIAALNRAMHPVSKRAMWDWFKDTSLRRYVPEATAELLSSQRFWDHMRCINRDNALQIWKKLLSETVAREGLDLSSLCFDGTNFYTFINSFNVRNTVAKRGKNKQGRNNLRQVSYALFCTANGQIPLMYDVYEGNRNDARHFPEMLKRFTGFLDELSQRQLNPPETTVVFDKGNNSANNFKLLDALGVKFVGSVKQDQVRQLAEVPNEDPQFVPCQAAGLDGVKAFRVQHKLYGKQRTLVVTDNPELANAQYLTLNNDISSAMSRLGKLQQRLEDRAAGIIKGGQNPTVASVERQCATIRKRQHMKDIIEIDISQKNGFTRLQYKVEPSALARVNDCWLGKTILITNREEWSDDEVIQAYRSQYMIEDIFREMKDRRTGSWWPMYHWTDQMIEIHGLYCSIAVLLRALLYRRVREAGLRISMKQLLSSLDNIKEVVNIFEPKRKGKKCKRQTVLTKTSERQEALLRVLDIKPPQNQF